MMSTLSASFPQSSETQPLVQQKSIIQGLNGKICFLTTAASLVFGWCVLDSWNRASISRLFNIGEVKYTNGAMDLTNIKNLEVTHPFNFPLSLALFQFAFMGIIFSMFWWLSSQQPAADLAKVRENVFSSQWGGLVTTHVFSTFWLQTLMMPTTMMTPLVFAASRALEVPAAAALRSRVIGGRYGGHSLSTSAMMFSAATLLMYSQTQIAECLCMWSGHGVELAGVALFLIYGMVLILPAANAVCLESVMVQLNTNPLLMLAAMNILASVCFAPIVAFAHIVGLENVVQCVTVTMANRTLYMMVLWLGVQIAVLSVISLALIGMLDSFWAVALRSFKAVFWWCGQLFYVFFLGKEVLSVDHPNMSLWGFVMMCGVILVGAAAVTDAKARDLNTTPSKAQGEKV